MQKSIPSEIASGIGDLAKDTVSEFVEKGILGNSDDKKSQQSSTNKTPSQVREDKKLEELAKKDADEKQKGIPDLNRMLKQQQSERDSIEQERQKRQQEQMQEAEEKKLEELRRSEEQSLHEDSLAATGHKMTARDRFTRKGTKETHTKQGM